MTSQEEDHSHALDSGHILDHDRDLPQDHACQVLTGQVVHARKCYKRLFFIDLRINAHLKCTILFRSDDTRELLPQRLSDLELLLCWKKVKRGDTITLQVFDTSQEETSKRDHPVYQATDFRVLRAWPADDPFPSESAMGLKDPIAPPPPSEQSIPKADMTDDVGQAPWEDYCKFWINSQKCLKKDCRKKHPVGEEYTRTQEIWVKERIQARRERSKLQDDPHAMSSKVPHSQRAYIFCRWLVEKFGQDYLNSGSGVLDIAGGKGEISLFLTHMFGIRSTVVEPNVRKDTAYQRRNLMDVIQKQLDIESGGDGQFYRRFAPSSLGSSDQASCEMDTSAPVGTAFDGVAQDDGEIYSEPQHTDNDLEAVKKERRRLKKLQQAQFVVPRLCTLLDDQFANDYSDVLKDASILIGMHPDQATEPIVDMALKHNKPFAVVPCCVFSLENPHRRLSSGAGVNTTLEFIQYLIEKGAHGGSSGSMSREFLPFDGMNIVVYRPLPSPPGTSDALLSTDNK
ncbi:hypothetical protein BGZ58_000457 [Dissophora ornata]|nr:hypothetical protein BGZ58_000457 [Dissophora ornata]